MLKIYFSLTLMMIATVSYARGTYQEPSEFIAQVFNGAPPKPEVVWITGELKEEVRQIMGHDLASLRLRYWGESQRSAWILEEVGKAEPITVGVVIGKNRIEQIKVLVFRESRGDEVRYPFFTNQFIGLGLKQDQQLSGHIDGISGATLSVRALTKIAHLALHLHSRSRYADDSP